MARPPRQSIRFPRANDDDVLNRLQAWEDKVFDLAAQNSSNAKDALRFRSTVPLDLLPSALKDQMLQDYREIIGFNQTLQKIAGGRLKAGGQAGINQILSSSVWKSRNEGYGTINVAKGDKSVLGYLYGQLNVQTKPNYLRSGVFDYFSIGSSTIPTVKSLRSGMAAPRKMAAGSKFVVFDIETGGLDFGHIRELSYASGTAGKGGRLSVGATRSSHLRSTQFSRGMLAVNGRALPMEDFMKTKFGIDYSSMAAGDGDDLVRKMTPFLQSIRDADHVVGHNISRFDIQQIFVGLAGTKAYKSNQMIDGVGFRDFVDDIHSNLDGKVIDTLSMAKNAPNLRGIKIAGEIAGGGSPYSISNLILQTDFIEKAKEAGFDLKPLIDNGKGLHLGSVDSQITAALAQVMPVLKPVAGGVGDVAFRRGVGRSAAILPITSIRDVGELSDELLGHLIETGGIRTNSNTKLGNLLKRYANRTGSKRPKLDNIIGMIRSGQQSVSFDPINAIEQEAFHTRNLNLVSNTAVNADVRVGALGRFNRLTGQVNAYTGNVKRGFGSMKRSPNPTVTQAQYAAFQSTAAANGIPYAGLSFEERKLGAALSSLTSSIAPGTHQQKAARIGADSLISHFNNYTNFYISKNPKTRIGIPLGVLDAISPEQGRSVTLSPFKYADDTNTDKHLVNAVYNFKTADQAKSAADNLAKILSGSDEEIGRLLGVPASSPAVANFRAKAPDVMARLTSKEILDQGVSVAKIHNDGIAKRLYGIITQFRGGIEADKGVNFSAPIIDTVTGENGGSAVRIGAPTIDRFADPALVAARAEEARTFLDDFIGYAGGAEDSVMGQKQLRSAADLIMSRATTDEHVARILKVGDTFSELRPNLSKAAGVAGIALIGFIAARKRKESQRLNEPLQQMPYEVGTNYALNSEIILRMANGENGASYMDPLATAPLVGNLYDNRTNHNSMAWDKNSALYGGVL